jgi:hypothetical protein
VLLCNDWPHSLRLAGVQLAQPDGNPSSKGQRKQHACSPVWLYQHMDLKLRFHWLLQHLPCTALTPGNIKRGSDRAHHRALKLLHRMLYCMPGNP